MIGRKLVKLPPTLSAGAAACAYAFVINMVRSKRKMVSGLAQNRCSKALRRRQYTRYG
jgi:hypothetical protein